MATPLEPQIATEETALLAKRKPKQERTPVPWKQISVILLIQVCEPIASQSIYPYINQLIFELDVTGGDEKKVGYYAGLVRRVVRLADAVLPLIASRRFSAQYARQEALFFVTEAMSTLQWSRASDSVGRKPILLIGTFGSFLSILCFGLSKTFTALVISRCLCGLLNGNVGVMKSTLGDLTDKTNRAEALVFLPIVWAAGASVGPLIGGALARPHDRFPSSAFFSHQFWLEFPYFLPCLVTGCFVLFSWFVVLIVFKETVPHKSEPSTPTCESPSEVPLVPQGPLPLRELITRPVLLSVANYVTLAFLNTSLGALIPLFLTMPISIGGLGLDPPKIGLILSIYGVFTGTFNLLFFAKLVRWMGEKRTFILGMSTTLLVFLLFPAMNMLAKASGGLQWHSYALVGCVLLLGAIMDVSFGAIFMFIIASAPRYSRGSVNGLSQTSASIARAIGPALCTSLFSTSQQYNLLGGYFVYAVFFLISCGAMWLADSLPEEIWDDIE
uniref:Major facilitator superfamily multidrug-resistance DHA1 sub-family n=1 Tax=Mycena chlorophos TaxID=658473 RepID=A0ABQ0LN38_MYCCL|nr:major facilitator superfamily multidrug-resistance DHA1 sub-family [Mycena chlorophos]